MFWSLKYRCIEPHIKDFRLADYQQLVCLSKEEWVAGQKIGTHFKYRCPPSYYSTITVLLPVPYRTVPYVCQFFSLRHTKKCCTVLSSSTVGNFYNLAYNLDNSTRYTYILFSKINRSNKFVAIFFFKFCIYKVYVWLLTIQFFAKYYNYLLVYLNYLNVFV